MIAIQDLGERKITKLVNPRKSETGTNTIPEVYILTDALSHKKGKIRGRSISKDDIALQELDPTLGVYESVEEIPEI